MGGEAIGGQDQAVAVPGLRFAEVDVAGNRTRKCGAVSVSVPTLENSGHWASSWVPNRASASEQEVLPSAALGLIEKPSGRVTVIARISEGDGVDGALLLGNTEVDGETRGRVGLRRRRLRVKARIEAELITPCGGGIAGVSFSYAVVIGEDFQRSWAVPRCKWSGYRETGWRGCPRESGKSTAKYPVREGSNYRSPHLCQ